MHSETKMIRTSLLEKLSHRVPQCRTPLSKERRLDTSLYKIPYGHYAGREADLSGKVWDSDGIHKIKPDRIPPRGSGMAKVANMICMTKASVFDKLKEKEKEDNNEGSQHDS